MGNSSVALSHAGEYQVIRHDLYRVIILNVIYLACILGIYFLNAKNGFLDNWAGKILHF